MLFSAHNIILADGTETIPGAPEWKKVGRCQQLIRSLNSRYDKHERKNVRILDLGCLEGGDAVAFAEEEYNVVAVEAREENMKKLTWLHERLPMPIQHKIKFYQADVRTIDKSLGDFEVVYCGGLLYHMDNPTETLNEISALAKDMLIVKTHYSYSNDIRYGILKPLYWLLYRINKRSQTDKDFIFHNLSKVVTHEGRKGRWYREWRKGLDKKEMEKKIWTAFNNHKSFWLVKEDLIDQMITCGFPVVYEQHNFMPYNKMIKHSYGMFIGIRQQEHLPRMISF